MIIDINDGIDNAELIKIINDTVMMKILDDEDNNGNDR